MRTLIVTTILLLAAGGGEAEAARRPTRCCVMVPADDGGERPWCFNLRTRSPRRGRRVCRLIGGQPQRPAPR
jgi:hypothetical protein